MHATRIKIAPRKEMASPRGLRERNVRNESAARWGPLALVGEETRLSDWLIASVPLPDPLLES